MLYFKSVLFYVIILFYFILPGLFMSKSFAEDHNFISSNMRLKAKPQIKNFRVKKRAY